MWTDLHVPIRATYLPLSQVANEEFPNLCTYVQMNFYHQGVREVWRPENLFVTHEFTSLGGVGMHHNHAIGINVQECIKFLGLPPKLRVTNIWREKLVVIRQRVSISTITPRVLPRRIFDLLDFINANFAVDVIWKPTPPQNSFLRDLIETVISSALGLVPGVGTLLSASFSVEWMAITDPDGFREWAQSGGWALTMIEAVIGSSGSMNEYVHPKWRNTRRLLKVTAAPDESALSEAQAEEREEPDWEQIGPSDLLLSGLRIIAYSAQSSKSRHDGQLHTEILCCAVKCGTISLPEALVVERGLEALPEEDPEKDPEVEVSEVQELD